MKYKLTNETIVVDGHTLHRIECVEAFADVYVGEKGGWIEKESNLSQTGNAWVYCDAKVYENAWVLDNARVLDNATISGNARVLDNATISGNARVLDNASVFDNARISDNANVSDFVSVYGCAQIYGNANVSDLVSVYGCAQIYGNAEVYTNADYIVFKNNWSSGRYFTWTRSNDMWKVGCFYGTGEELIKKAYQDSENSGKHYEAYVKFVEQLKELDNGKQND